MSSFSQSTANQLQRARDAVAAVNRTLGRNSKPGTAGSGSVPTGTPTKVLPSLEELRELKAMSHSELSVGFLAEIESHLDALAHPSPSRRSRPLSYDERGPFRNLGEQLAAVARIAMDPAGVKARQGLQILQAIERRAAPAGGGEQIPGDGGFLVSTELADDL